MGLGVWMAMSPSIPPNYGPERGDAVELVDLVRRTCQPEGSWDILLGPGDSEAYTDFATDAIGLEDFHT